MELFKELLDYDKYLKENPFHENLKINLQDYYEEYGQLNNKIIPETYYRSNLNLTLPISQIWAT
jgi:hypothetical protein